MFVRPFAHLGGTQNKPPVWQTPSGQILSLTEGDTASMQLVALDLDQDDVLTYSLDSGSLPTGFTLSSSGLISGTAEAIATDPTISTFTVRVTDGKAPRMRQFSIAVKKRINVLFGNGTGSVRTLTGFKSFDEPQVNVSTLFGKSPTAAVLHQDKLLVANAQAVLVTNGDGLWSVAAQRTGIVSMASNGTIIVGVGTNLRATSTDGVNWTTQPATNLTYQMVKWDGTYFWALHDTGLQRSTTGFTWENVTVPGNGTFMAVESNGAGSVVVVRNVIGTNTRISTDNGQTWTASSTASRAGFVRYWPAQSLWLKGGGLDGGRLMSSPDGITWVNFGASSAFAVDVTAIEDRLAAAYSTTSGGDTSTVFSLTNGTTTGSQTGGSHQSYSMLYQPSARRLWTFGADRTNTIAPDICRIASFAIPASGLTLPAQVDDFYFPARVTSGGFVPACWTGREFIIPEWNLWTPNGHDYRYVTNNAFALTKVAMYDSASNLYIVGTGGIRTCAPEDLLTANSYLYRIGGTTTLYMDIERNDTLYVIVGNSGNIFTASVNDPTAWTKRTTGTTLNFKAVCWTGQRWLALASTSTPNAYMTASNDGITWTAFPGNGTQFTVSGSTVTLPIMYDLASDGNGNVVMSGTHRMVSTNHGATWTTAGSNENGLGVEWSPTLSTFVATSTALSSANPASPPQKIRGIYNTVAVR